jgi:hypothetical protein
LTENVNGVVLWVSEFTHGTTLGANTALDQHQALPILHMTISDENKRTLLRCPEFIPLLVSSAKTALMNCFAIVFCPVLGCF